MIIKHRHFEFGGGCSGEEEADGVRFKNLFNNKSIKIEIKHVENIKIIVYIQKYDNTVSIHNLENMKEKTIKKVLHKNDTIYFGYIYNNIKPPILDFKIIISE